VIFVKSDRFNGSKMSGHHWLDLINCNEHLTSLFYIDYMIHEIEIKLTFQKNKMFVI